MDDRRQDSAQSLIFAVYVQRMLQGADSRYDSDRTLYWLAWLARRMSQHSQTLFLLERIQPSWLSSRRQRWLYVFASRLATSLLISLALLPLFGVLTAVFVAVSTGLLVAFLDARRLERGPKRPSTSKQRTFGWRPRWPTKIRTLIQKSREMSPTSRSVRWTIVLGAVLATLLLCGLNAGVGSVVLLLASLILSLTIAYRLVRFTFSKLWGEEATVQSLIHITITVLAYALVLGIGAGLVAGPLQSLLAGAEQPLSTPDPGLTYGLIDGDIWIRKEILPDILRDLAEKSEFPVKEPTVEVGFWTLRGLITGLFCGLLFGLFFGLRSGQARITNDIRTVEALKLSAKGAGRGAVLGLVTSLILGVIGGPLRTLTGTRIVPADLSPALLLVVDILSLSFLAAIFTIPLFGLVGAVSGRRAGSLSRPNQGIRLSLRNAILASLILGSFLAVVVALLALSQLLIGFGESQLALIISLVLLTWMPVAMWYGGADVLQHYLLRFLIYRRGHAPWNYVHFLDYAAERHLLQKAGGGYLFAHSLLQDFLAERVDV